MDQSKGSSVCRLFYDKFPQGKPRVHAELVKFLINHPSSRTKLEEWVQSVSTEETISNKEVPSESERHDPSDQDNEIQERNGHGTAGLQQTISHFSDFSKCDTKSEKQRELGNTYFKQKNLIKSLYHYNQAIKVARFPQTGVICTDNSNYNDESNNCLSIALANRSAVYNELGECFYKNALQDVDLALKYGYPERLATKLVARKAGIYVKQGKGQLAQECLDTIKSQCKNKDGVEPANSKSPNIPFMGNITENAKIDSIEMQIRQLLSTAGVSEKIDSSSCMKTKEAEFSRNRNFENASDLISIKTTDALGRHVIALTDLKEGQVLFREEPFASVLLPEFYDSRCHHCHKPLQNDKAEGIYFFPCKRCTQVLFCDDRCADAAELYHVHECGWLNLLHSVGIAHLAIRIVLVAGVDNVLECVKNHLSLANLTKLNIFKPGLNNYHRVYSLVDHITDMFEEDLFQYTLTASLLTRYLSTKTSFLHEYTDVQQLQVGGVLLRHICQLVCNAHAITDVLPDNLRETNIVIDEFQKRVATAIFPAASIMNHSCDSNITFYFVEGKTLIVKGARDIKKGTNVYNCYGPHYRRMTRTERQEILMQQYFFRCNCDKCEEELRTEMSFADQFQALKCEECEEPIYLSDVSHVTCQNCGKNQNMMTKIELLHAICDLQQKGDYLLERLDIQEATGVFQTCYKSALHILYKYNSQFGKICDSLARCYVMKGNFKEAKELLNFSLGYVETRFGKGSVEFVRESLKYQEVCDKC